MSVAPTETAAAGASRHNTGRQRRCGEAASARATASATSPCGDSCLPVRAVEPAWQVREDHTTRQWRATGFSARKENTEGCRQPGDELQRGLRPRRSRRQRAARYRARRPALRHVPAADGLADTYAKREPASREDGITSRRSRTATTVTASRSPVNAGTPATASRWTRTTTATRRRPGVRSRRLQAGGRPRRQAGGRRRQRRETRNRRGESGAQERARGSAESSLGSDPEVRAKTTSTCRSGARPEHDQDAGRRRAMAPRGGASSPRRQPTKQSGRPRSRAAA